MWPIPALDHRLVSIMFSSQSLVCCWIERVSGASAPFLLRAYKKYSLSNGELEKTILFNPTIIKKYIRSFLDFYSLQDVFIVFCFDGPSIIDHYVEMPTSTPSRKDFTIAKSSAVHWQYNYVYPNDQGLYVFYVYAVPRTVILQYQLLGIALRCNVIAMTSKKAALLYAYRYIFGAAFRKCQLAIDMMHCDNNLENCITADLIKKIVAIPIDMERVVEYSDIAMAYGLLNASGEIK